jgi:sugar phosphate isomerase/epimerase
MQVSMSSWSYRQWFDEGKCDLLSFLDEAKRLGADGVEIFPQHVDQQDPGAHLKKVAAKARKLGLKVFCVIAGNDFARRRAVERAEQVERMKAWIGHTAGAGVKLMNTFTGYHASGEDPQMEVCRVIDAYREVMPVAEEHGVLLCIENHSSVASDADGILHIIRQVGSPNLRTNPDPTNFVPDFQVRSERARETVYSETAKYATLASNAHLKIGDFTEEGEHAFVDTRRLIEVLRTAGYDGPIALELYGRGDPAEPCRKGVELLRRYT